MRAEELDLIHLCVTGGGRDLDCEPRAVLQALQRVHVQHPDVVTCCLQPQPENEIGGWGSEGGEGVCGLDGGVGAAWGAGEGFRSETAARDTERFSGGGLCCCAYAHRM